MHAKCYRCGEFYTYHDDKSNKFKYPDGANGFVLTETALDYKNVKCDHYFLCPDCMIEVEAFLKNGDR